jgi:hypothetical protein
MSAASTAAVEHGPVGLVDAVVQLGELLAASLVTPPEHLRGQVDHGERGVAHLLEAPEDVVARGQRRRRPGGARDVDRHVADALEMQRDVHQRHEETEIGRDRLLSTDEVDRAHLDLLVGGVDVVVICDHRLAEAEVGVGQRPQGQLERGACVGGHRPHLPFEVLEVVMELRAVLDGRSHRS